MPRSHPHKWRAAIIFILAFGVRLIPVGRYVTPDEAIWVLRSVRLADAITARNWAAIPQTGHPGLTTMMLGALGVRLTEMLHPAQAARHLAWIRNLAWLAPENAPAFEHLAFFLPASRILVAGVTALGIALAYRLAQHVYNERTARWLALCLALDPFSIGLSSLLHTDALQATFLLLAVLLISRKPKVRSQKSKVESRKSKVESRKSPLSPSPIPNPPSPIPNLQSKIPNLQSKIPNLQSKIKNQKYPFLLPALLLALAGLTKTLGLLAAPGMALAIALDRHIPWRRRLLRVVTLTACTLIFILALYPPFWADPVEAFTSLIGAVGYHEGIGNRAVFFWGQTRLDPGPFFYPLVLLFRLTPPVILGLGLTLFRKRRPPTAPVAYIWLPLLTYIIPLSLAGKKFDRYALTLIPLLTLLAMPALVRWGQRKRGWILAALLLPWALVAPLPLMYANPMLGGPWIARHIIPLGWGEASGIAAAQATRMQPTAHTLLTTNVPGSTPFFPGDVWPWQAEYIPCADVLIGEAPPLPDATMTRRTVNFAGLPLATVSTLTYAWPITPTLLPGPLPGASAAMIMPTTDTDTLARWINAHTPLHQPFAWIHASACYPLADAQLTSLFHNNDAAIHCAPRAPIAGFVTETCRRTAPLTASPFAARFDGTLDLVAATWPATLHAPDALATHLRWLPRTSLDGLNVHLALWDGLGTPHSVRYATGSNVLIDQRGWAATAWEAAHVTDGVAYIPLPLHLPPGPYTLTLSLTDSAARQLGVTLPDGTFGGTRHTLGTVHIAAPPYPARALDLPLAVGVDFPGLRLSVAAPPSPEHWAGDKLRFSLGWERLPGQPPETVRWSLDCAGSERDAGTLALSAQTFAVWPNGHRYITHHAPRTRPGLTTGVCEFNLSVGNTRVALGDITVQARTRRFTLDRPPDLPLAVTVGDFAAIVGADVPTQSMSSGDTFTITLYWEAQTSPGLDYSVFVHLVDAAGTTWAQSDTWPENGNAPTTSWLTGQIVVDTHTLTLPAETPDGPYTLFAGLYDAGSGGRVPLYTQQQNGVRLSDDRTPIGTVMVGK